MNLWKHKLAAYLHDPPSKALDIRTHGERSDAAFRQAGFLDTEIGEYFAHADHTGAAADRFPFPLSRSASLQCAFDGCRNTFRHPLSGERLKFHAEFTSVEQGIEGEGTVQPVLSPESLAALKDDDERTINAYDGYLGGYIHLRPREGWNKALAVLSDGSKPLPMRLAAVRTVRLYHGWQPKDSRDDVLKCLSGMITQGELADVAIEDLRRWQMWDLTRDVVALYGKKGFDAPIMQRAIVRYALCVKEDDAAKKFMAERRRYEPDLVKEVEESLQFEK